MKFNSSKNFWLWLFALTLPWLLLEGTARTYIHFVRGHELRDHYAGGRAFEIYVPTYVRLRPNTLLQEVGYYINRDGFLNDTLSDADTRETKVVALGGSTSFFANYFDDVRRMYTSDPENTGIGARFASAGTPGYTTYQSLLNLITRILPLKPDVLVFYHGVNDLLPLTVHGVNSNSFVDYFSKMTSLTGRGMNFRDGALDQSAFYTLAYNQLLRIRRSHLSKDYTREDLDSLTAFEANLTSIIGIASSRNIDIVLVTFAHRSDRQGLRTTWGPEHLVAEALAKHNDIIQKLAGRHRLVVVDAAGVMTGEQRYFTDTVHFTSAGAEKLASLVYPAIKQTIHARGQKQSP